MWEVTMVTHDVGSNMEQQPAVTPGDVVYTESDEPLGVVTEYTTDGVEVTIRADRSTSADEETSPGGGTTPPGQAFGEGYLMWRCGTCGEVGSLESGMPNRCPTCGARREKLYRRRED